jgi:hypothetical protein
LRICACQRVNQFHNLSVSQNRRKGMTRAFESAHSES